MIQNEEPTEEHFNNPISDADKTALLEISKWTRVISVIGFAIGAFIVIVMLFGGAQILKTLAASMSSFEGMYPLLVAGFFVVFFLAAMVLYFLHKASQLLLEGLRQQDEDLIAQAFVYLKNFFKAAIGFTAIQILSNISNLL